MHLKQFFTTKKTYTNSFNATNYTSPSSIKSKCHNNNNTHSYNFPILQNISPSNLTNTNHISKSKLYSSKLKQGLQQTITIKQQNDILIQLNQNLIQTNQKLSNQLNLLSSQIQTFKQNFQQYQYQKQQLIQHYLLALKHYQKKIIQLTGIKCKCKINTQNYLDQYQKDSKTKLSNQSLLKKTLPNLQYLTQIPLKQTYNLLEIQNKLKQLQIQLKQSKLQAKKYFQLYLRQIRCSTKQKNSHSKDYKCLSQTLVYSLKVNLPLNHFIQGKILITQNEKNKDYFLAPDDLKSEDNSNAEQSTQDLNFAKIENFLKRQDITFGQTELEIFQGIKVANQIKKTLYFQRQH